MSPQNYSLSKPWNVNSLTLEQFMVENQYDPSMFQALIFCPLCPLPINKMVFQLLPCLKVVVTTSTGVNHIDLSECQCRGIQVANVGSLYSEDVADVAVALLIGVLTSIVAADRFVRATMQFDFPQASYSKVCLFVDLLLFLLAVNTPYCLIGIHYLYIVIKGGNRSD